MGVLNLICTAAGTAGMVLVGAAGLGQAGERAARLEQVAAWPSAEGDHFVDLLRRDPEGTQWAIEVLRDGEFERGPVTPPRGDALLEGLRQTPWEHVRDVIHANSAPGDPAEDVVASLRLLGSLGDAAELAYMIELASPADGSEEADAAVCDQLQESLAELLRRDARVLYELPKYLGEDHRALWRPLTGGVGESGSAGALDVLARMLDRDRELDGMLLPQIGRLAANPVAGREWQVGSAVRAFLMDPRAGIRREAALALGKLQDSESVEDLIRLLDDDSSGVRKSALWALRAISGQDLGEDPLRWRNWYLEELQWWREVYPGYLETLRYGEPEEIGPAVSQMCLRRLFRNLMAEDLAALLEHERPEIRLRACVALRELGSMAAARELVTALTDEDEAVREAAYEALRAASDYTLPPEPELWIEALGIDP